MTEIWAASLGRVGPHAAAYWLFMANRVLSQDSEQSKTFLLKKTLRHASSKIVWF